MEEIINSTIKVIIEAILISGILGYYIFKRNKFFDSRFNYKLRAMEELLAPVKLQLIRSKITLYGYDANNKFREEILKECNEKIRKLLLEKGHLIPVDLIPYAEKFIKHYDEWLQAYQKLREVENDKSVGHVFTYDFPHDAEDAFTSKYELYRKELKIDGALK